MVLHFLHKFWRGPSLPVNVFLFLITTPSSSIIVLFLHGLPSIETSPFCCAYVQVDGKLFIIDEGIFEMLREPPPPRDNGPAVGVKVKFDWSWCTLPSPPFHNVISHGVHPDQRTMVFSMTKYSMKKRTGLLATFSFDLESSRWTQHGAWALPFKADNDDGQPPACKLSKERLFCVDTAEKHIGATLVHMGGDRSMVCLVQYLSIDNHQGDIWKEFLPQRIRYLLRITTFSPKYDKHEDLRIAKCHHIGSYQLPEIATVYDDHLKSPMAFWILSLTNKFHEQLRKQKSKGMFGLPPKVGTTEPEATTVILVRACQRAPIPISADDKAEQMTGYVSIGLLSTHNVV
ncbi:Os02g0604200 [Oryza sativa Japonica Group]|uniref:Os02g0604200 protein n=1 Tax=Oryza sativa subsp. japonica TaxID=39947 RepID=A0A0P0VLD1_ORYSJ|nr:Os02g0604200 [Oryza sativa Japonica Group]